MKTTTEVYYHNGKFWYSENGWPGIEKQCIGGCARPCYDCSKASREYKKALQSAIASAIEIEDQDGVADLCWRNDGRVHDPRWSLWNWKQVMLKEGVYTIPEMRVEILYYWEQEQCTKSVYDHWVRSDAKMVRRIARLLPLEMKEDQSKETQEEIMWAFIDMLDMLTNSPKKTVHELMKHFTITRK